MINTNKLRIWSSKLGILGLINYLDTKRYFFRMNQKYKNYIKTGKIPIPERFVFDLTFKCNHQCKMCYINFPSMWKKKVIDGNMELNTQQIKEVFDKIPKLTHVTLIGGEIFTRSDLFEILDYFKSRGTLLRLSTNLTLLNDEKIERLKTYTNIEAIGTSIDGDKELHNSLRDPIKREAFDKTIQTITKLKDNFFIGVVGVILDDNLEDLNKILKIAKDAGAHLVTFEFERKYNIQGIEASAKYLNFDTVNFPILPSENLFHQKSQREFADAIERVTKQAQNLGIPLSFLPIKLKENLNQYYNRTLNKHHFCKHLFIGRIDAQGNLVHCFAIRKSFGNLLTDSFENIWNSFEFEKFRTNLTQIILPICETCEKLIEVN